MAYAIYRDNWGIPHLRADSVAEVAFAQGFTAATDRAWQLQVERWRSEGRLAEHVGGGETGWDRFARRALLARTARRCYENLDGPTAEWVRSYVDGVNAGLPAGTAAAPEFAAIGRTAVDPWQPWHPLGVFLVQHILFGTFPDKLWRSHVEATVGADAAGLFSVEGAAGSNAWAGPYEIAGDPHRVLELPGIYQQVRLACDEFDVVGLAFPGVPGVPHFGHAGPVAWAVTNAMADYQDLYREDLRRAGDLVEARGPSGWEPVRRHVEAILVRDGDPVPVEVIETPRGPVIDDAGISLRYPALVDGDLGFGALLPLLRARTASDVADALRAWVEPVNSVLVADDTGTVLQLAAGRVPLRDDRCREVPVPAWDPAYHWRPGYAPMARVAVTGTAVNANDRRPDVAALGNDFAPPHRANRIAKLRAEGADAHAVFNDCVLNGRTLRDLLVSISPDGTAGRLRDHLLAWDGRMAAGSVEAGAYAAWRSALARRLHDSDFFAPLRTPSEFDALFTPWTDPLARIGLGLDRIASTMDVREAATLALTDVAAGPPPGAWGARHRLFPVRVDVDVPVPAPAARLGGDNDCVLATSSVPGVSDACWRGPVARYVWDLRERANSRWVVPFGASGIPGDEHFADQLPLWSAGELTPIETDWSNLTPCSMSRVSADVIGKAMPAQVGLDDLAAMNAFDTHGHRYETSPEGMLSVMPPPDSEHAGIASDLLAWFVVAGWLPRQILQAAGIRIPGEDGDGGRIPDITIWSKVQPRSVWLPITDLLLVIEIVSVGSRSTDKDTKRHEYAAAGIAQYWVVDRDAAQTVTLYRLGPNDTYVERAKMPLAWLLRTEPSEHLG